jgi:hypothetical protein
MRTTNQVHSSILIPAVFTLGSAASALASRRVTVTAATGGSAISADTTGGAWTTLTGPIAKEGDAGSLGNGGSNYIITFVNANLGTVSARPITVTAAANGKVFDGSTSSTAVPSVTSGSLVAGDAASLGQSFADKNAAALGLQYQAQVSGDKQNSVSDIANLLEMSVLPLDSQLDWVIDRDTMPITPDSPRFIQLKVLANQ